MGSHYCEKCRKTMDEKEFYKSNNLEKYPDNGILNLCKKCLTMHIDNWNSDTFLYILEDIDVPWVPDEWNKLMQKYAKDPSKLTGTTIFGRYLSKMRLKQYKDFRWKDNELIQKLNNAKIEEAMKNQGYSASEIAETLLHNGQTIPKAEAPPPPEVNEFKIELPDKPAQSQQELMSQDPNYFDQLNGFTEEDLGITLTDDEKLMLRLKWGSQYRPEEWVTLEKLYNDMMESYDIQSAGHIDTLKKVCRTSLKADQLLNIGDIDGAQKAVKMYDMLMKSGKFTAAQNKAENGEFVDSVSELVALCESDGFIPKYYSDGPKDHVDEVLQDLQFYTRRLITEEMNLGNLINNALKQIQIDQEREASQSADAATDSDFASESLTEDEINRMFETQKDYEDFAAQEEEDAEQDNMVIEKLVRGEV